MIKFQIRRNKFIGFQIDSIKKTELEVNKIERPQNSTLRQAILLDTCTEEKN